MAPKSLCDQYINISPKQPNPRAKIILSDFYLILHLINHFVISLKKQQSLLKKKKRVSRAATVTGSPLTKSCDLVNSLNFWRFSDDFPKLYRHQNAILDGSQERVESCIQAIIWTVLRCLLEPKKKKKNVYMCYWRHQWKKETLQVPTKNCSQ